MKLTYFFFILLFTLAGCGGYRNENINDAQLKKNKLLIPPCIND